MNLKQKSVAISVGTTLTLILLITGIIYKIMGAGFQNIENQNVDRNIHRLEAIIIDQQNQINSKLSDWSIWDDSYNFLKKKNQSFIKSNFSVDAFKNININQVLFIDSAGGLVTSFSQSTNEDLSSNFPQNLYANFATGSALLNINSLIGYNSGILRVDDDLILFSVRPVVKSDGTGIPAGYIVFARTLDDQILNSIKNITQFEAEIVNWDDQSAGPDFQEVKSNFQKNGNLTHTKIIDKQNIHGYLIIKDIYDRPQAIISCHIPRDITLQGSATESLLSWMFIAAGIATALINFGLLTRGVLGKISNLSSEVETITSSGTLVKRLGAIEGQDEIDLLKIKINKMLSSLQTTQIAIESSSAHVVITDPNGSIIFANHAAEKLTGYSVAEMMGKTPRLWGQQMSSEFYQKMWDTIKNKKEVFSGEITNKRKDGELYTALATISPVLDERGDLTGFVALEEDITQRKEDEVALKQNLTKLENDTKELLKLKTAMMNLLEDSRKLEKQLSEEKAGVEQKVIERTQELSNTKAKLDSSIENLPLGFLMTDIQENFIVCNSQANKILNGQNEKENLDLLKKILSGKLNLDEYIKNCGKQKKGLNFADIQIKGRFYQFMISPILTKESEEVCIGVVILIQDITEEKILDRSKDEFFSIASHELRTPLTAIRGNTSMILEYYADALKDPELKAMIDDVHESSIRLINIVNDFLNVSRLEQQRMVYDMKEFDINQLIPETIKEYDVTGSRKKINITYNPSNPLPPAVLGDPDKVRQIIINLLGNAIKFTKEGEVQIHTEVVDHFVKVFVSDTGIGIPLVQQSLLFHKFQQAGESLFTRDTAGGSGLGLYISKMMIEGMGGEIKLEKSEENKGSTFSFTLPIAEK